MNSYSNTMDDCVFIGVDLGASLKRKSTGLACIVDKNGMPYMDKPTIHIISDDESIRSCIIRMSQGFGTKIIAIDAPLSRPEHGTMRECETRLRNHGIACFPSGAEWVNEWIGKAICLKDWAEHELSSSVIEVYPYAARVALHIGIGVKKKSKPGRTIIQDALLPAINGLSELIGDKILSDDELDAILSAYTAYLKEKGTSIKIDGVDGAIYLPLKKWDHEIHEY